LPHKGLEVRDHSVVTLHLNEALASKRRLEVLHVERLILLETIKRLWLFTELELFTELVVRLGRSVSEGDILNVLESRGESILVETGTSLDIVGGEDLSEGGSIHLAVDIEMSLARDGVSRVGRGLGEWLSTEALSVRSVSRAASWCLGQFLTGKCTAGASDIVCTIVGVDGSVRCGSNLVGADNLLPVARGSLLSVLQIVDEVFAILHQILLRVRLEVELKDVGQSSALDGDVVNGNI
jgi:hypothetical protein